MKENVLDVLMYLFEHYMDEEVNVDSDEDVLRQELSQAGFPEGQISKAFAWLEDLHEQPEAFPHGSRKQDQAMRIYTSEEADRLEIEGRGFLLFLEQVGVLDPVARECVIAKAMALEVEDFDLEQLKWVVLMVLFNRPGSRETAHWMEDLVFSGSGSMH